MQILNYWAILAYWAGWILFVVGQCWNALRSPSNKLSGVREWLGENWYSLIVRLFFSIILQALFISYIAEKIDTVLEAHQNWSSIADWGVAGIAGYAANTLLYQIAGFLGSKLRAEPAALMTAGDTRAIPNKPSSASEKPPGSGTAAPTRA
jgi:hypothetical protein